MTEASGATPKKKRAKKALPSEKPLLLSVSEAANLLGCGRSTLYARMDAGEIRSIKFGRSRRIARREIESLVERLADA